LKDDIDDAIKPAFSALAKVAASLIYCSFFIASAILIVSYILFLSSISFLAYFSAAYRESAKFANFSLIAVSYKFLPSA